MGTCRVVVSRTSCPPGRDASPRDRKRNFHLVHGAEGDGVELAVRARDLLTRAAHTSTLATPRVRTVSRRKVAFLFWDSARVTSISGRRSAMGRPGKPAARAEVEQGSGGAEIRRGEEAFAEVAADDLFRIANGGEVGAGVPLEQKVEIGGELGGARLAESGKIGTRGNRRLRTPEERAWAIRQYRRQLEGPGTQHIDYRLAF